MSIKKPEEGMFSEDALLKAMAAVESDILKSTSDETVTDTPAEEETTDEGATTSTPAGKVRKSDDEKNKAGAASKTGSKGLPATQAEANGGGSELGAPGTPLAKSATADMDAAARQVVDATPFLAHMGELLDQHAEAINAIGKSLDSVRNSPLNKLVLEIGRGVQALHSEQQAIQKRLGMPIRTAPKSALSKGDVQERFEDDEQPAPNRTLTKSDVATVLTDLVMKGEIDEDAVFTYEGTGRMSANTKSRFEQFLKTQK